MTFTRARASAPFERIAEAWNERNLCYAVAHGLGSSRGDYGRDLDVVVRSGDLDAALRIAVGVLTDSGFRIARPPRLWGDRIVAIQPEAPYRMLELHLLRGLSWRNVRLATVPRPTGRVGPYAIDPWISVAKRVLHPALAGDVDRFETRPEELRLSEAEHAALLAGLRRLAHASHAAAFVGAVEAGDRDAILAAARTAGRTMMVRAAVRSPAGSLGGFARALRRRVAPPFLPCAPVVALVGPDGVGKSTAIRHLSRTEGWVFTDTVRRHWRPGLLPELSTFVPGGARGRRFRATPAESPSDSATGSRAVAVGGAESRPPRRRPGRLGGLRIVYYLADAWLGGWLRDRAAAGRQSLVLYDRCLLDMVVDPARYGLRDGGALERLWEIVPRPDRVVLLAGVPTRIVARKPELSVDEVRRQLAAWRRLAAAGSVHAVVDADRPETEVATELRRIVAEAMLERNPAPSDLLGPAGAGATTLPDTFDGVARDAAGTSPSSEQERCAS